MTPREPEKCSCRSTTTAGQGEGEYVRETASRILWIESVADAALKGGMVPVLWDTGHDVSRTDGTLSPELKTVFGNLSL